MTQLQFLSQTARHYICSFLEEYQGHLELPTLFAARGKLRITLGNMATGQIRDLRIKEQNSLKH